MPPKRSRTGPFRHPGPDQVIPEEEVPVRLAGRLVLDEVVNNFFAETEQVAFCTQNIVRGIDFTDGTILILGAKTPPAA